MGYSIVLAGMDFSQNNVGKVTLPTDVSACVRAYTNLVGTAYKTELTNMVSSLVKAGLWDKMVGIYPVLGDSVALMCYNLKDVTEFNLSVNTAAAAAGDKLLTLSHFTGAYTCEYETKDLSSANNIMLYACASRESGGYDFAYLADVLDSSGNTSAAIESASASAVRCWSFYNKSTSYSAKASGAGIDMTAMHRLMCYVDGNGLPVLTVDGTEFTLADVTSVASNNAKFVNTLGFQFGKIITNAASASANTTWGGNVSFYALGEGLTADDTASFDDIVSTFLTAVGKM